MTPEEKATSCGLFNWRPTYLRKWASAKLYLALYVATGIFQTMMFSYLSVVLSTVEKRFGLKSQDAAWLYSGNEISQIFFIFALPFVGRVKRRPLYMGLAIMLGSLGCFMISLPHFFGDKSYELRQEQSNVNFDSDTCLVNGTRADSCASGKATKDLGSLAIIFMGIFLMGIGVSFFYSFGIPYVDDNSDKTDSPFRLSIILCSRTLGPTLGYILGASMLAIYINPSKTPDFDLNDPRWLGAWWIGFIIVGVLLLVSSPFLTLFPQRLPSSTSDAKMIQEQRGKDPETAQEWLEELYGVTRRLLTNKVWMLNVFSTVFVLFGFIGLGTFMPKYLEYHFRQNASKGGGLGGLANALPTAIGMLISGYIVGKKKPSAKALAGYCAIVAGLGVLAVASLLFLSCPKLSISGVTTQGNVLPCNNECQCASVDFHPICSMDGQTNFFSPCHAGCKSSQVEVLEDGKKKKFFEDCSCVAAHSQREKISRAKPWWDLKKDQTSEGDVVRPLKFLDETSPVISSAVEGYCPYECKGVFYGALGILLIIAAVGASARVPNMLISLRMIDIQDKAASLTLQVSVFSLLVFLPSPILVGALIDSTCEVWAEKCGETTNCLVYDTDLMRHYLFGMMTICMFLGFLCDVGVWYYIGDLKVYDSEFEDDNKSVVSGFGKDPIDFVDIELETKQVTL